MYHVMNSLLHKSIIRILGKRGRITIPYKMRVLACFKPNDILRFDMLDSDTIVIKREYLCDGCEGECLYTGDIEDIEELFDELTLKEKHELLTSLTAKWASIIGGESFGKDTIVPLQH